MAETSVQFKSLIAAAAQWAGRMLFPPVCAGCQRLVAETGALCGECWPKLRFLEQPWCDVLGTPFSYEVGEGMLSADAIANPPPFRRARAAVSYNGVARQMVLNLKFGDRTELAPSMARWMLRVAPDLVADADLIVPVPLHRTRYFNRRFNQSAELARALCALTGKRFAPEVVIRARATRQQVGLTARAREENVRGAFRVPKHMVPQARDKHILVIDDVYTTGNTVTSLTKTLKRAGATEVDVLTFARVLPGDFRPEEAGSI